MKNSTICFVLWDLELHHYWSGYLANRIMSLNFVSYFYLPHTDVKDIIFAIYVMLFKIWLQNTVISWKALWNSRKNQVNSLPRWNSVEWSWLKLVAEFICLSNIGWLMPDLLELAASPWLTGWLNSWPLLPQPSPPTPVSVFALFAGWLPSPSLPRCCQKIESTGNDNKIDSIQAETSDKNKKNSQWKSITTHKCVAVNLFDYLN